MITVKLKGGLGNQLFQYAFGRTVSLKLETPLVLDVSGFNDPASPDIKRSFQLGLFSIQATISNGGGNKKFDIFKKKIEQLTNMIKNTLNPYDAYVFNPKNLEVKDGAFLEGRWQSEKYFSETETTLRHDLVLKEKLSSKATLFKDRIKQVDENGGVSVSVHIRRCDYVTDKYTNTYHGVLDITYYQKAISALQVKLSGKQLVLFIFSDDINWVRENLKTEVPHVYVSRLEIADYEDLFLMSKCSHNIIANSSFSWWGAWLNPKKEKIVIAPKRWITDTKANTNDVTPLDWIKI